MSRLTGILAQTATPSPTVTGEPVPDSADLTNPAVLALFAVIIVALLFVNWRLRRRL